MENVPYIVHESDMARLERTIKRLWIICILLILLLVGTNIAWIIYESQFVDEIQSEQEVETSNGETMQQEQVIALVERIRQTITKKEHAKQVKLVGVNNATYVT